MDVASPPEHVVRGLAGAEQVAGGVAAGRLRGEPAEAVGGAAETAAAALLGLPCAGRDHLVLLHCMVRRPNTRDVEAGARQHLIHDAECCEWALVEVNQAINAWLFRPLSGK